jgi:hypothetical protein
MLDPEYDTAKDMIRLSRHQALLVSAGMAIALVFMAGGCRRFDDVSGLGSACDTTRPCPNRYVCSGDGGASGFCVERTDAALDTKEVGLPDTMTDTTPESVSDLAHTDLTVAFDVAAPGDASSVDTKEVGLPDTMTDTTPESVSDLAHAGLDVASDVDAPDDASSSDAVSVTDLAHADLDVASEVEALGEVGSVEMGSAHNPGEATACKMAFAFSNEISFAADPVANVVDGNNETFYSSLPFPSSENSRNVQLFAFTEGKCHFNSVILAARWIQEMFQCFPGNYSIAFLDDEGNWGSSKTSSEQPDLKTKIATVDVGDQWTNGIRITPDTLSIDSNGGYFFQIAELHVELM